jgi:hypothetical protein
MYVSDRDRTAAATIVGSSELVDALIDAGWGKYPTCSHQDCSQPCRWGQSECGPHLDEYTLIGLAMLDQQRA